MGTTGDWLSVLLSGGFYGVAMGLWNTPQKPAIGTRKSWLVGWMFAGLLFGILSTFGWRRALHPPIVFVTVAACAGIFVLGLIHRSWTRNRPEAEPRDSLTIPPHLR